MSRTSRRKSWGQPGAARDGRGHARTGPTTADVAAYVTHPERRERDREAEQLASGELDADNVSTKPVRGRLWRLWWKW